MSFYGLDIASLHALPVGLVAVAFERRGPIVLSATVMALVAVVVGNSSYWLLDLLGVAGGLYFGLWYIDDPLVISAKQPAAPKHIGSSKPEPETSRFDSELEAIATAVFDEFASKRCRDDHGDATWLTWKSSVEHTVKAIAARPGYDLKDSDVDDLQEFTQGEYDALFANVLMRFQHRKWMTAQQVATALDNFHRAKDQAEAAYLEKWRRERGL